MKQQITKPAFEQHLTGDRKMIWKAQKRAFKDLGWKFSEYSMEKKVGNRSICIEFCMGDFCVGLYSEPDKGLIEPKKRCETLIDAVAKAYLYEFEDTKRN